MYKSYHVSLLYRYSKLSIPRTASNSNDIRVQGAPIPRLEPRKSRSPSPPSEICVLCQVSARIPHRKLFVCSRSVNWRVVKWCEDNVRDPPPPASLRPVSRFKNWQVVSYAVDIAHEEQPDDHLVLSFHDTYKGRDQRSHRRQYLTGRGRREDCERRGRHRMSE